MVAVMRTARSSTAPRARADPDPVARGPAAGGGRRRGLISTQAAGAIASRMPTRPVLVLVCQCSTVRPVLRRKGKSSLGGSESGLGRHAAQLGSPRCGSEIGRRNTGGRYRPRCLLALRTGPLHPARGVDPLVGDAAVVTQPASRHPGPFGEGVLGTASNQGTAPRGCRAARRWKGIFRSPIAPRPGARRRGARARRDARSW